MESLSDRRLYCQLGHDDKWQYRFRSRRQLLVRSLAWSQHETRLQSMTRQGYSPLPAAAARGLGQESSCSSVPDLLPWALIIRCSQVI